mgnify:CR=1 FL=1
MWTNAICPECQREFNLFDEKDNQEWYYGHDCESVELERVKP